MPKKQTKGKSKKASKAKKTVVINQESLEAQTQRMKIGNETQDDDDDADDALLEEAIKLAAAEKKDLKAEKKKAAKKAAKILMTMRHRRATARNSINYLLLNITLDKTMKVL